jgi:hypothetical protein
MITKVASVSFTCVLTIKTLITASLGISDDGSGRVDASE